LQHRIIASATCATILLIATMGCAPRVAQEGDVVTVDYVGEFVDGTQFDSSKGREPLQFTIGQGMVVPGFENAVLGMQEGETKTVELPCEDAYGARNEELVFNLPTSEFGTDAEFVLGAAVALRGNGVSLTGVITEFTDTTVTVDANHPLAGETLVFHLELIEIIEPK